MIGGDSKSHVVCFHFLIHEYARAHTHTHTHICTCLHNMFTPAHNTQEMRLCRAQWGSESRNIKSIHNLERQIGENDFSNINSLATPLVSTPENFLSLIGNNPISTPIGEFIYCNVCVGVKGTRVCVQVSTNLESPPIM